MSKIVLASGNAGKVREINKLLADHASRLYHKLNLMYPKPLKMV